MLNMQSYFVTEFDFKENEDPLTFDFPPPSLQKHVDADEGSIMELLWHQGPVAPPLHADPFVTGRDVGSSAETSQRRQLLMEEDEMATWLHQYQIEERGEIMERSSKGSSCCQEAKAERVRVAEAAAAAVTTAATTTTEFDAAGRVLDVGSARDSGGCSAHAREGKRKARTGRDSGCHREDVGVEHSNKKKEVRTSRTRAAEVHNLSERRRRDKINEKMKALQELIPRCNKSDKASMLDDAIEYLKSLQLQVQMLSSMQYNMGHMMFPDVQRYMQTLGFMGMSMAMASGGIQRPMMSFAPILPYSPMIATPPPNLQPRPVPSFHLANAVIPDQVRTEASNQQDAASNSINLMNPNMVQDRNFANPYHHFAPIHHFQVPRPDHILAKPGKFKGTHDNTKD